jgi:hypothetical protein
MLIKGAMLISVHIFPPEDGRTDCAELVMTMGGGKKCCIMNGKTSCSVLKEFRPIDT